MRLGVAYAGLQCRALRPTWPISALSAATRCSSLARTILHPAGQGVVYADHRSTSCACWPTFGFAIAFGGGRVSRLLTENPDVVLGADGVRRGIGCMNLLLAGRKRWWSNAWMQADGFFWDSPRQDCTVPTARTCSPACMAATHAAASRSRPFACRASYAVHTMATM